MFDNILMATDNVEIIDNALIYINSLFPDSDLHIISIHDERQATTAQLDLIFKRLSKEGANETASITKKKLESLNITARVTVLGGNPVEKIAEYVQGNKIDLIVAETYDKYGYQTSRVDPLLQDLHGLVEVPFLVLNKPDFLQTPNRVLVITDEEKRIANVKKVLNFLFKTYKSNFTFLVPRSDEMGNKPKLTKPILDMGLGLKTRGVRVNTLTNLTTVANASIEHSQTHTLLVFSHHERRVGDVFSNTLKKVVLKSRVPVLVIYPNDRVTIN